MMHVNHQMHLKIWPTRCASVLKVFVPATAFAWTTASWALEDWPAGLGSCAMESCRQAVRKAPIAAIADRHWWNLNSMAGLLGTNQNLWSQSESAVPAAIPAIPAVPAIPAARPCGGSLVKVWNGSKWWSSQSRHWHLVVLTCCTCCNYRDNKVESTI